MLHSCSYHQAPPQYNYTCMAESSTNTSTASPQPSCWMRAPTMHQAVIYPVALRSEDGDTLRWLELATVPVLCIYHRKYTNLILAILYYEHQEKSDQAFYCLSNLNDWWWVLHLSEYPCSHASKGHAALPKSQNLSEYPNLNLKKGFFT